jgi:hypothetical protein
LYTHRDFSGRKNCKQLKIIYTQQISDIMQGEKRIQRSGRSGTDGHKQIDSFANTGQQQAILGSSTNAKQQVAGQCRGGNARQHEWQQG